MFVIVRYLITHLVNPGINLNPCGCFYCNDCFKSSRTKNSNKITCVACSKDIDDKKVINTNDRNQVGKVAHFYENPDMLLKKSIETINVCLF